MQGTWADRIARDHEASRGWGKTADANRTSAVDARYKRLSLADNLPSDIEGARLTSLNVREAAAFR